MGSWIKLLACVALFSSSVAADSTEPTSAVDTASQAVDAYRSGDYETAHSIWLGELDLSKPHKERARLAYNLGNAAFRSGDVAEAIGWYTASLRLHPRDADVWANLELARSDAGLEPADRGDLAATLERVFTSLTQAESEWLLFAALCLWVACLAGEALRGGSGWRRGALLAFLLVLLCAVPWVWRSIESSGHPMLVVGEAPAARSEPRPDAKRLKELALGSEVQRLDELPGWIQVRDPEGERVWVRDRALFDLVR